MTKHVSILTSSGRTSDTLEVWVIIRTIDANGMAHERGVKFGGWLQATPEGGVKFAPAAVALSEKGTE